MSIRIPVIPYEEQDSFPTPLPPIPEDMNTVDDDYEIYVDHEDGQRIKARPKVNIKEGKYLAPLDPGFSIQMKSETLNDFLHLK